MDPDYWHQRWQDNRTGFHQDRATPLMLKHWPSLRLPAGSRVFVPLCGKSLDMVWLAEQGHRVLGVELSQLAIEQFFESQRLTPTMRTSPLGRHYTAGDIEIIHGDAFALDARALAGCSAVHDRAALIALPPATRQRYVRELHARLPAGCRGLLITLEYPPREMEGPPFTVPEREVRDLYGRDWQVEVLERRAILDSQPAFAGDGVTSLETVVYRLDRHPH